MPFHFLLPEAILCHGKSLQLVRIFNCIGTAASIDTTSQLATQVSKKRIAHGIKPKLTLKTVTAVSIDNLDILQPHAFVSSTDAS